MKRSDPGQGDLFAAAAARDAAPAAPLRQSSPSDTNLAPATPGQVEVVRPAQLPPGSQWRETRAGQQVFGYVLVRSRRSSIGFVISDEGLRVTAPTWASQAQIDDAVRQKSSWIIIKLGEWQNRREQLSLAHTRWQDGGELPYLGIRIRLALGAVPDGLARSQMRYDGDPDAPQPGDRLHLSLPHHADNARVRDTAEAWLQQQAGRLFQDRLQDMAQRHGLTVKQLRLSSARTRWGSCTSDARIMLNWRLIHFTPAIIDYVIAHELAHLREMNHSRHFWNEVERIVPDYEQARDALRRYHPGDTPVL